MLFNSYLFIFAFLPVTFFIYFYLNHMRLTEAAKAFLVFGSLVFYSWWDIAYLPIILSSMLFNYTLGNALAQKRVGHKHRITRHSLLLIGIIANIALLGYFKYTDFLIENINLLIDDDLDLLDLTLPLAISFFTFQQIAYLVDSHRQETQEYDFLNYAVFVTFFPQLIAGPIVHHKEMMPQFTDLRSKLIDYKNISLGLFIFTIGLFKKVVIADTFATWATPGFDIASTLDLFEAWATSLSYTFQLYFDFSGYTDMAIGLALLFNIRLPINFNSPYKATTIQDFWRRWHITLSRFLRDYVYIPLGGNRKGEPRTYINLMATFILGGIWHGAGWTFVFWGTLHGLGLVIHRAWSRLGLRLWTWLAWLITFNFINITWVFFRAKEWDDAMKVLGGMFSLDDIVFSDRFERYLMPLGQYGIKFENWMDAIDGSRSTVIWIVVALFIVTYCKNSMERAKEFKQNIYYALMAAIVFDLSIHEMNKITEFLYFNF